MIMRDKKLSDDLKPLLYKHIQDIVEDTCAFDWPTAVWPWSEEVFSQVDEGRLSWTDTLNIQMLRMSMSRTSTAKLDFSAPLQTKQGIGSEPKSSTQGFQRNSATGYKQAQPSSTEILKGGPPCEYYNSHQGCNHQFGHFVKGQSMIHVCRYCLFHTSAPHQHSEVHCRNKGRQAPHHFQ